MAKTTEVIGGKGFQAIHLDMPKFCRMVAKIAHSFVVAEVGYDTLCQHKMLLPDFILNGSKPSDALINVGGFHHEISYFPPDDVEKFAYRIDYGHLTDPGKPTILVARVRLFSWMGAPEYHVAVAELIPPCDLLASRRRAEALNYQTIKLALAICKIIPVVTVKCWVQSFH